MNVKLHIVNIPLLTFKQAFRYLLRLHTVFITNIYQCDLQYYKRKVMSVCPYIFEIDVFIKGGKLERHGPLSAWLGEHSIGSCSSLYALWRNSLVNQMIT